MCSPTFALAAAGLQAFGQVTQAMQASKTAKANAQIARVNADIKNKQAADATQRGADRAALRRQEALAATASLRARAGSSGFLADTGTNLDLQEQNAGIGEMNSLAEINNADAARFRTEGRNAMVNGLLGAGTTLVSGGANYGKSAGWWNSKSKGVNYGEQYGPTYQRPLYGY